VKKPLIVLLLFCVQLTAFSQEDKIAPADRKLLQKKEDSLRVIIKNMYLDSFTAGRMRSDSQFIKTLVRSLQVKNSFYYPFDSVKGISKIYAPDSSFKIFTWHLDFDGMYIRQRGAIQMRTANGSLKLIPLRDYSEFSENVMDSVRTKDTWIGAVYYNIIQTKHNGKNYYTLFGFDENTVRSNRKWIEVLTFDQRNMPVFGGPYFSFAKDSIKKPDQYRFSIEYKKDASTTMNYEPEFDMILVDHLISETDEPENPWTLVPDGDYEGFKWVNGKWLHINKVFDQKLEDGAFPMPDPLKDDSGNNDQKKMDERNQKNKSREKKDGN